MAAAEPHEPHVAPDRRVRRLDRALDAGWDDGRREIKLYELDLDAAVHDESRIRRVPPRTKETCPRRAASRCSDTGDLGDDYFLVRSRARGDVEYVRECVALYVIVDDLDVAV